MPLIITLQRNNLFSKSESCIGHLLDIAPFTANLNIEINRGVAEQVYLQTINIDMQPDIDLLDSFKLNILVPSLDTNRSHGKLSANGTQNSTETITDKSKPGFTLDLMVFTY
jgi:hypothetical protein